jgi:hypothetical protein
MSDVPNIQALRFPASTIYPRVPLANGTLDHVLRNVLAPGTRGTVHVQELEFEDAKRSFEESKRINERLTELYVKHNTAGKTYAQLYEAMKFDTFLSAKEAVEYGLADKVIEKRP